MLISDDRTYRLATISIIPEENDIVFYLSIVISHPAELSDTQIWVKNSTVDFP